MANSLDYIYLRAWCRIMGSNGDWTRDQLERARKQNAPATAIYEKGGPEGPSGEWAVFEDIANPETTRKVEEIVARMKGARR